MTRQQKTAKTTDVATVAQWLVEAAGVDTVYADVYQQRARTLLASVLPPGQYAALQRIESDIADAVRQTKMAAMRQDWERVDALAAQVETLRQRAGEQAALRALGDAVYAPGPVAIDPFSPGLEAFVGSDQDLATLRDQLVDRLRRLAAADAERAALYEARRAFFARLGLVATRRADAAAGAPAAATSELERLAAQAAHQGDIAQVRRYAQELLARRAAAAQTAQTSTVAAPAALDRAMYQCPVDLAAPLPPAAAERAAALGLVPVLAAPLPEGGQLIDYVATRIWQPMPAAGESEREGAMRIAAVVEEAGLPPALSEPVKVLVGQFLRNPFVNSGGARFLPQLGAESVLIEDFAEDAEPPAGELLAALGLDRRRGLSRSDIDAALRANGVAVIERLGLDPLEARLVCIPHDLYMRCGRERGWGQREQWTHFDGYQVLKNGALRALVGGDVRHGGLSDLLSIALGDRRECVVARFAVIRRARQVARWQ